MAPALLTPRLVDTMRKMILGKDWEALERFPGWTMREINPTVRVVGHVVGKDAKAEALASPGAAVGSSPKSNVPTSSIASFIDLGPFRLDHPAIADLDQPSKLPGFTEHGIVTQLGDGVTRGDGPDPALAPLHAESARLAYVLNRLSLNDLDSTSRKTSQFTATISGGGQLHRAATPEQLIQALIATGHNTADAALFDDPRDAEVNALIAAIPKDRSGTRPEPERIFGSLPTTDLHAITIPGLADDLQATLTAWEDGDLQHTHGRRFWTVRGLEALGFALAAFAVYRLRRPVARTSAR